MTGHYGFPQKPKALRKGSSMAYFAPASPPSGLSEVQGGVHELQRFGYEAIPAHELLPTGYFAASSEQRFRGFRSALRNAKIQGLVAVRGGYGSTYLLDDLQREAFGNLDGPKFLIGYSDITALQTYLWQSEMWVTFYGPMLAAGFGNGAGCARGYDEFSFLQCATNTVGNWSINLSADPLMSGEAEGGILGGCLSILQTSLGTPWELNTENAILLLEDTHMKPYQVDRALMHLKQAGKLSGLRGVILGDFPNCDPPVANSPTVHEVCKRILAPLGVPVVYGAPIGHTARPMLTVPLGVRARLHAKGEGTLEILEPTVVD